MLFLFFSFLLHNYLSDWYPNRAGINNYGKRREWTKYIRKIPNRQSWAREIFFLFATRDNRIMIFGLPPFPCPCHQAFSWPFQPFLYYPRPFPIAEFLSSPHPFTFLITLLSFPFMCCPFLSLSIPNILLFPVPFFRSSSFPWRCPLCLTFLCQFQVFSYSYLSYSLRLRKEKQIFWHT